VPNQPIASFRRLRFLVDFVGLGTAVPLLVVDLDLGAAEVPQVVVLLDGVRRCA
jgi:hypothetical protein